MKNTKPKKQSTNMEYFIRHTTNGYAIQEIDGGIVFDGFESEDDAASMVVQFCQDHKMFYTIYH